MPVQYVYSAVHCPNCSHGPPSTLNITSDGFGNLALSTTLVPRCFGRYGFGGLSSGSWEGRGFDLTEITQYYSMVGGDLQDLSLAMVLCVV